jgi:hypothetical protein
MKISHLLLCFLLIAILLPAFAQTPCPCCTEAHRQFDFWAGEWEVVKTSDGSPAGSNRIVILQDSCTLQENWQSAGGNYTGTSYNFYNSTKQKWQQVWIDNQGGLLELEGVFSDSQMVMLSPVQISKKGKAYVNRITWTRRPDGTVRQQWEVSAGNPDGSWNSVFDGIYKRK